MRPEAPDVFPEVCSHFPPGAEPAKCCGLCALARAGRIVATVTAQPLGAPLVIEGTDHAWGSIELGGMHSPGVAAIAVAPKTGI